MKFLDHLHIGVQIIARDMTYAYLNPSLLQSVGKSLDDHLGKKMEDVYPGIDKTDIYAAIVRCMNSGLPYVVINEFVFENGRKTWWELRLERIPEGVLIFSVDITDRKRQQDLLIETNQNLEKLLGETNLRKKSEAGFVTLGKMISGVAHEINSPLQNILTSTEVIEMLSKSNDSKALENEIDSLKSEVLRTSKIIESMKSLVDEGPRDIPSQYSVSNILESVRSLVEKRVSLNSMEFSIDYNDLGEVKIRCNKSEILQILINLIENSFYSLGKSNPPSPRISIEVKFLEQQLSISVSDNGSGIPEADFENIFNPLFTTKEVGIGAGLGLSISRSIALKNQATLSVSESEPMERTTFQLNFSEWNR